MCKQTQKYAKMSSIWNENNVAIYHIVKCKFPIRNQLKCIERIEEKLNSNFWPASWINVVKTVLSNDKCYDDFLTNYHSLFGRLFSLWRPFYCPVFFRSIWLANARIILVFLFFSKQVWKCWRMMKN